VPYGISNAAWAKLPPEDQAAAKAWYESNQVPPPITDTTIAAETGGGGTITPLEQQIIDAGLQGDILDVVAGTNAWMNPESALTQYFASLPEDVVQYDFGESEDSRFNAAPSYQGPTPATFSDIDVNVAGAPEWWKAVAPDQFNPLSEYQSLSNMFIPFLSPEDQRTVASNLFQSDSEQFSFYDPEKLELYAPPDAITPDIRQRFLSGERATQALNSLDRFLSVTGKKAADFGPGYSFLRGIADTIADFGLTSGASQFTETQQKQLLSALDPQLAQVKSQNLSAFGPLAKSFAAPFFSAGSLQDSGPNLGQF